MSQPLFALKECIALLRGRFVDSRAQGLGSECAFAYRHVKHHPGKVCKIARPVLFAAMRRFALRAEGLPQFARHRLDARQDKASLQQQLKKIDACRFVGEIFEQAAMQL